MRFSHLTASLILIAGTTAASTPIGPYGTSGITAIAVHPRVRTRVYAAAGNPGITAGEGLYRSDDGGATWTEKTHGLPPRVRDADIESIAADATTNVYVTIIGSGVFRSTDNGETWSLSLASNVVWTLAVDPVSGSVYATNGNAVARFDGNTWTTGQALPGFATKLAVDPNDGRTIYASTGEALYRSSDGAQSWQKVYSQRSVGPIAIDANGVVYAGTNDIYNTSASLLAKSSDHGATWSDADGDLHTVSILGTRVEALAVDGATLVASMRTRMYRSTDAGAHWTKVVDTNEGGEILQVAAAAPGAFLAGVTSNSAPIGGILRSSDGGASWRTSNDGIHETRARLIVAHDSSLFAAVDVPPVDLGLYRTDESGKTWRRLSGETPVQQLVVSGARLISGASFGVRRSADGGATWTATSGIDCVNVIGDLIADPSRPGNLWAVAFMTAEAHIHCLDVFHSTDDGATWTRADAGLPLIKDPYFYLPIGPMAVARGVAYIWTITGVYASSDGATWSLRGTPRGAHALAFTASGGDLWLLSDAGLLLSHDGATTWQLASPLSAFNGGTLAVTGSRIAVSDGSALFLSNDGGATWSRIGGDLLSVIALAFDGSARLIAGTDSGVYIVADPPRRRATSHR